MFIMISHVLDGALHLQQTSVQRSVHWTPGLHTRLPKATDQYGLNKHRIPSSLKCLVILFSCIVISARATSSLVVN